MAGLCFETWGRLYYVWNSVKSRFVHECKWESPIFRPLAHTWLIFKYVEQDEKSIQVYILESSGYRNDVYKGL